MALPTNDVLTQLYDKGTVTDADGSEIKAHSYIPRENAEALYKTILANKPTCVIEVGMCMAVSSIAILSALRENGHGKLISIDPNQNTDVNGIGLLNIKKSGLDHLHELMEMPSHQALPKLLSRNKSIDFAYIDGWHTFDYTLVDFFYIDKMLGEKGIVGFNDCGWRSVHKVLKFLISHRHYRELDVGLKRTYKARNPLFSIIKRLEGRVSTDRYFVKEENWEPSFSFYRRF
ncbi:hypothetical protein BVX94_02830 [bacterium B17]|nr:hypothetical protein BVX94_02830 [bacterium B17]